MKPRERGRGRIFRRNNSGLWWCSFYLHGREVRESTGVRVSGPEIPRAALRYLDRRLDEVATDRTGAREFVPAKQFKITVSELLDALRADYELRGKASAQNLSNIARANRDFGDRLATSLTAEDVDKFINERLADGSAPASINRVLQLLGQSFRLAIKRKHLANAPHIRRLSEKGNVRRGFFEPSEFYAIVDGLPDYLKDFAYFAYLTGMRKGEIASLRWADVDSDTIRLRAEDAKNGCARSVPLEDEIAEIVGRRRQARVIKREGSTMLADFIFHRDGQPIGDIRKSWHRACCLAGVGKMLCPTCSSIVDDGRKCARCEVAWTWDQLVYTGKLFHDFRRTAVRDMIRGGTPEAVAMSISGHKTRSMLDRYNITSEADQRRAIRRTAAYRRALAAQQHGAQAVLRTQ